MRTNKQGIPYADPNKAERNRKRLKHHVYGKARRQWAPEDLQRFVELNRLASEGSSHRYIFRDHELAEQLQCSLASVQYLRRKANIIRKSMRGNTPESYIKLLQMSEDTLKKHLNL